MEYRTMFSPVKIGTVQIPNRFATPPMGNNFANTDGTLREIEGILRGESQGRLRSRYHRIHSGLQRSQGRSEKAVSLFRRYGRQL